VEPGDRAGAFASDRLYFFLGPGIQKYLTEYFAASRPAPSHSSADAYPGTFVTFKPASKVPALAPLESHYDFARFGVSRVVVVIPAYRARRPLEFSLLRAIDSECDCSENLKWRGSPIRL
jgi:hypothetical protein